MHYRDFEFDFGNSGKARKMFAEGAEYTKKIVVPFCPESELSGINYKDFMHSVWYRRNVDLVKGEGRTLLHFEACDFETTVWVNGVEFPKHIGGYTGFVIDITKAVRDGENTIVVNAVDLMLNGWHSVCPYAPPGLPRPLHTGLGILNRTITKRQKYDQTISRQSSHRAEGGRDADSIRTVYS